MKYNVKVSLWLNHIWMRSRVYFDDLRCLWVMRIDVWNDPWAEYAVNVGQMEWSVILKYYKIDRILFLSSITDQLNHQFNRTLTNNLKDFFSLLSLSCTNQIKWSKCFSRLFFGMKKNKVSSILLLSQSVNKLCTFVFV